MKKAYLNITSWSGISINAVHYYGKLNYGKAEIEVRYPMTESQARHMTAKDNMVEDADLFQYQPGDMTGRFDSQDALQKAAIDIFEKFINPQGFDILIKGEHWVAEPQPIIAGDKDLMLLANRLYFDFEVNEDRFSRTQNQKAIKIAKKWEKLLETFKPKKRFKIICANKDTPQDTWTEEYTEDDLEEWECATPEEYGREVVDFFNSSLRPGEKPRVFLGVDM